MGIITVEGIHPKDDMDMNPSGRVWDRPISQHWDAPHLHLAEGKASHATVPSMARAAGADPLAPLREASRARSTSCYGKERFLVDRAVDLLRARVLDPRTKDFNYELFYGKEAGAGAHRAGGAHAADDGQAAADARARRRRDEGRRAGRAHPLRAASRAPETCLVLRRPRRPISASSSSPFKKHGVLRQARSALRAAAARLRARRGAGARRAASSPARPSCSSTRSAPISASSPTRSSGWRSSSAIARRPSAWIAPRTSTQVVATTRQRSVFELCNAVGEGDRERALAVLARCWARASRACGSWRCWRATCGSCGARSELLAKSASTSSSWRRRSASRRSSSTGSRRRRGASTARAFERMHAALYQRRQDAQVARVSTTRGSSSVDRAGADGAARELRRGAD